MSEVQESSAGDLKNEKNFSMEGNKSYGQLALQPEFITEGNKNKEKFSMEGNKSYGQLALQPTTHEEFIMEGNLSYNKVDSPQVTVKERIKLYEGSKSISQDTTTNTVTNKTHINVTKRAHKIPLAWMIMMLVFFVLVLSLTACCIAFAVEISHLKSDSVSLQQKIEQLNTSIDNAALLLIQEISTVDGRVQQLNTSLDQQVNSIEDQSQQIVDGLGILGEFQTFPSPSCAALPHSSPSGYYWVRRPDGSAVRLYCDMTRSCGGVTGGWARVAELDFNNLRDQCPEGFSLRNVLNTNYCRRDSSARSCVSVVFSTSGISYSRVCGRIIGIQIGTTESFGSDEESIDGRYVDGISLTYGNPRQHIWTFVMARDETASLNVCLCQSVTAHQPPSFVRDDYFCDTAFATDSRGIGVDDPLWDGEGCEGPNNCCSFNTPPWFYRQLPQPTTDYIEMRVCRDFDDEDTGLKTIDLLVQ